jgi:phage gpG-like protein
MDGIGIRIEENATPTLREMARRMRDFTPILPQMVNLGVNAITENFRAEGRPTKWRPLMRVPKSRAGGKILTHTGHLEISVHKSSRPISKTAFEIGSILNYAAAHQLGVNKTVQVQAHTRRITSAFGRRLNAPTDAQVGAFSRRMRLPARPFLILPKDDLDEMAATAAEYLTPRMEGR